MANCIFIDESGDPGFTGAHSPFFVMTAIVVHGQRNVDDIVEVMATLRRQHGWSSAAEFKFNKTRKTAIAQCLQSLSDCQFEVYGVVLDKAHCQINQRYFKNISIYQWTLIQLLKIIEVGSARIIIDGKIGKKALLKITALLRKALKDMMQVKSVAFIESQKSDGLQVADLVAGAINQSQKYQNHSLMKYVAPKIKNLKIITI